MRLPASMVKIFLAMIIVIVNVKRVKGNISSRFCCFIFNIECEQGLKAKLDLSTRK